MDKGIPQIQRPGQMDRWSVKERERERDRDMETKEYNRDRVNEKETY